MQEDYTHETTMSSSQQPFQVTDGCNTKVVIQLVQLCPSCGIRRDIHMSAKRQHLHDTAVWWNSLLPDHGDGIQPASSSGLLIGRGSKPAHLPWHCSRHPRQPDSLASIHS